MFFHILITVAAFICSSADTVQGIRCKEGINITAFQIPFYHWSERECTGNSRCFTQEIGVKLGAPVNFRYGGCISTAYSESFSCEKLFGHDSNLDPSVLLDLLADADDWIDKMVKEIKDNVTQEMRILFSKGRGTEDLIEGGFLLYEMLGFNMEKARELKKPLANLFELGITLASTGDISQYRKKFPKAKMEFEQALENLDTNEPIITAQIYKFIGNFDERRLEAIKSSKLHRLSIEKLPGLYKSMLAKYNLSQWIDVTFEMIGAVDITQPEKSATGVVNAFRSSLNISEESREYIDPFLDTVPEYVRNLTNPSLIRPGRGISAITMEWVADIMRKYGRDNAVTSSLGDAIVKFIRATTSSEGEIPLLKIIRSLPGLFNRFFPAKKSEIDRAFTTVTRGLRSFNYQNIAATRLLEKTKLSDFIMDLIDHVRPDLYSRIPGLKMKYDRIIINLSKTFYNAMTDEYTDELDVFFTTLDSEFAGFPAINSGGLISSLVTNLGGEVPADVRPLLSNMQNIINSFVSRSYGQLYSSVMKMIRDYKQAFPDSKFPDIGRRYLENVNSSVMLQLQRDSCYDALDWSEPMEELIRQHNACLDKHAIKRKIQTLKLMKSVYSVETDLFFAVFEAAGFDSDERIKNISAISKPLATYLQLFRVIDPDDVKEILSDYATWLVNLFQEGDNYEFDNFLYAMNATTAKITSKLGKFMKDLRHVHAPEYCKYLTCRGPLCNTHEAIDSVSPIRKEVLRGSQTEIEPKITATDKTTTAATSNAITTHSTTLTVAFTLYLTKVFL